MALDGPDLPRTVGWQGATSHIDERVLGLGMSCELAECTLAVLSFLLQTTSPKEEAVSGRQRTAL